MFDAYTKVVAQADARGAMLSIRMRLMLCRAWLLKATSVWIV
jgi:hypothetical protein